MITYSPGLVKAFFNFLKIKQNTKKWQEFPLSSNKYSRPYRKNPINFTMIWSSQGAFKKPSNKKEF